MKSVYIQIITGTLLYLSLLFGGWAVVGIAMVLLGIGAITVGTVEFLATVSGILLFVTTIMAVVLLMYYSNPQEDGGHP